MSVWLRGQDPSWAAEHFAIYLSTTGTSVSDFTVTLVPETEATGEYVEYTADLSEYAGQEGYIAIRHFNVTDMFRLNVDDFFIGNNSWTTINGVTNPYTIEGLAPETSYQVQVQGNLSDDTTEWSELSSFTTPVAVPVTISSVGYSTLYYGMLNLVVPEGVIAYTYSYADSKIEESKIYNEGEVIPAGTGVVLEASEGDYYFVVTTEAGVGDSDNALRGSDEAELTTGGDVFYALSLKDGSDPLLSESMPH